jgi:SAM-dependent methyltransferase
VSNSLWAAGRYESVAERIATIAGRTVAAVERRRPLSGATLVDLACGTGSASLAAAARGALVTGVDLTPELIEIAEHKARSAGQTVTWVAADAADTKLPGGAFDAVVSNMGIIFVDPDRQVGELGRLLKPAGVLAFSSWVRDVSNPFFDPIVAVLGAPPTTGFSPDQWGDPAIATRRLADCFTDVDVDDGMFTWEFASLDAALHFLVAESPMHVEVFRHVEGTQRERLEVAFRDALRPHVKEGRVSFDTPYVVISASRR